MKNKTVSIIGIVGIPAKYGGFESLAENLVKSKNMSYEVYCESSAYDEKPRSYNGVKLHYIPVKANGIQSVLYDICSMLHAMIFNRNHLLVLGVSGAICIPFVKLFSKRKVVTNIDGLEWKREKWGKLAKWFLRFSESIAVKFSDVVVSDNQAITNYVNDTYSVDPITIAYGGDHATVGALSEEKSDYYLGICRIEPENNVHMILDAFTKSDKKIKFIGNWQHSSYSRELKKKYSSYQNIDLVDPIYDIEKLSHIRSSCIGYIHGHSAGGTNPSLVEMMHFGVNIICYNCNYNIESTLNSACYFDNADELNSILDSGSESLDNGLKMKEIALQRYTWDLVTKKYESLF